MDKIIFLDFDGVINNNKEEVTGEAITTLKKLVSKSRARVIVISSIIRNNSDINRERAKELLYSFGIIDIDFLDFNFKGTFLDKELDQKTLGIIDYLKVHMVREYVILDDENAREYRLTGLNYYKTAMWAGLKNSDLAKIKFKAPLVKTMNSVNYYKIPIKKQYDLIRVLKRVLKRWESERQY